MKGATVFIAVKSNGEYFTPTGYDPNNKDNAFRNVTKEESKEAFPEAVEHIPYVMKTDFFDNCTLNPYTDRIFRIL